MRFCDAAASAELIEGARYPVTELDSPAGRAVLAEAHRSRAEKGVAILPGFLRPEAAEAMAKDMVFEGRNSLHRVTPVVGDVPRYVALLAYDTRPGTDSSDLLKLVRYGRTQPLAPDA